MKLTLEKATIIVDRALTKAREMKIRPLCVAVLDGGGNLKALKRDDGASILRPQIAIGKAKSRRSTQRAAGFPRRVVGHVGRQSGAGCWRRLDSGRNRRHRRSRGQRRNGG
jgi:uncharacterized protein GlcG (DUF336 family)